MTDRRHTWTEREAQEVLRRLRKTKPPPRQFMSTRQALYQYYLPTVLDWLAEGWRYEEVVAALAEQGVPVKRSTLYSYVRDYRKQQRASDSADRSQRVPDSATTTAPASTDDSAPPPDRVVTPNRNQTNGAASSRGRRAALVDRLNRPL
ncbi:MAG: hypothetical protein KDK04_03085 [Candidatus Competibacteraceae bacterium]|nr:hypothetical protein [Caldilineaceae bacterium]MCB1810696.1 hypothetical protein [Candidatus Competibacteraceae bacterium]